MVRGYLITLLAKNIDIKLVTKYYHHILKLPVSSISLRQTGEYLSRFSDIDTIRNAISDSAITIILDSFLVIGCGIILFFVSLETCVHCSYFSSHFYSSNIYV